MNKIMTMSRCLATSLVAMVILMATPASARRRRWVWRVVKTHLPSIALRSQARRREYRYANPDRVHLNLAQVARLHKDLRAAFVAHATRRAGHDHVARRQRQEGRSCPWWSAAAPSPFRRVLSVIFWLGLISSAVTIQGPRPPVRQVFAWGPLGRGSLPVTDGTVVVAAVADDVVPGVSLSNAPATLQAMAPQARSHAEPVLVVAAGLIDGIALLPEAGERFLRVGMTAHAHCCALLELVARGQVHPLDAV